MNRHFVNLEGAVRLFDLIKFRSDEARLAFYYSLSDTLYCQDSDLGMDYAMKHDSQRRRVISKSKKHNGYILYEMSGLISNSTAKRGGFIPKASIKVQQKGHNDIEGKALENRKKEISSIL